MPRPTSPIHVYYDGGRLSIVNPKVHQSTSSDPSASLASVPLVVNIGAIPRPGPLCHAESISTGRRAFAAPQARSRRAAAVVAARSYSAIHDERPTLTQPRTRP